MKPINIKTIIAFLIGAVIALIVIYFLELESVNYEGLE